jgi:hypothetical protein
VSRNLQDLKIIDFVSCKLRDVLMGPKRQTPQTAELFRQPLSEQHYPKHDLVLLGDAIDWSEIERSFSVHFASTTGGR